MLSLYLSEQNGWTALLNAAYWCHPDAVQVLLNNDCDVLLKNKVCSLYLSFIQTKSCFQKEFVPQAYKV